MSGKSDRERSKPVGLVIATYWEAGPILRHFPFRRVAADLYRAEIAGRAVLVAVSGVGMEPARRAAYRLCSEGAGELVSVGFCGALVPELEIGELLTDRVATAAKPVRSPAEREALTQRANARAVDMETQAIIEAGTRRGVPIRVLRVVSDRTTDDLTPIFGPAGDFKAWKIALRLLNPFVWPMANRLRRSSQRAKEALVRAVEQYLGEHSPSRQGQ